MIEPFDIINLASTPRAGGVSIDIEAIAVALVTVVKMNNLTKEEFLRNLGMTYDETAVKVIRPDQH